MAAGRRRTRPGGPADQGHGLLRRERHRQSGPAVPVLAGRQPARAQDLRAAARLAILQPDPQIEPVTNPAAPVSQDRADYLRDVCRLLWPAPAEAVLTSARPVAGRADDSTGNLAERGPEDGGMLVLPGLSKPRLVVPSHRRVASVAVRRYGEPGSARTRLAARALSATLASGIGGLVLRDRIVVRVPPGAQTIESHLSSVLGQRVLVSIHLGAARANRKPVL